MNIEPSGSLPPKDFLPQKKFDENSEESEIARLGKAIRYAPDAENLEKHSFKPSKQLARQLSMPDLTALGLMRTKEEEMKRISSELWTCVDIRPDPLSTGRLCVFKLKEEYDSDFAHGYGEKETSNQKLLDKQRQIYPATEPLPFSMVYLNPEVQDLRDLYLEANDEYRKLFKEEEGPISRDDLEPLMHDFKYQKSLNKLGYSFLREYKGFRATFLVFPDKTALVERWDKLRLEKPQLSQLDVALSEGIAGDLDFVKSFFSWDALLSTGKEFVHDQVVHVLVTLKLMLSTQNKEMRRLTPDETDLLDAFVGYVEEQDYSGILRKELTQSYSAERLDVIKEMAKNYHKILFAQELANDKKIPKDQSKRIKKQLPKIEVLLGAMTDSIFAQIDAQEMKEAWKYFPQIILDHPYWLNYLNKRFPEGLECEEVMAVWKMINTLYEKK